MPPTARPDRRWRRLPGGQGGKLEAAGAKALCEKDAEPLGGNIIHSVTNPIPRLTGGVHGPQVVRGVYCHIVDLKFEREVLALERLHPRHVLAENPARLYGYQGCAADWGQLSLAPTPVRV